MDALLSFPGQPDTPDSPESGITRLGVEQLPSLAGVLHPEYTADIFGRALYTAAAMVLLGGLAPAIRAALARPLEALRHE
jgi:ABC-type lipoprotein release transport system permease subunit